MFTETEVWEEEGTAFTTVGPIHTTLSSPYATSIADAANCSLLVFIITIIINNKRNKGSGNVI